MLCLSGFSLFMHIEGRKTGDNQHTVKLLPPPPGWIRPVETPLASLAARKEGIPVPSGTVQRSEAIYSASARA